MVIIDLEQHKKWIKDFDDYCSILALDAEEEYMDPPNEINDNDNDDLPIFLKTNKKKVKLKIVK